MTLIHCSRCKLPIFGIEEPASDGGGDPSLMQVLIPPNGTLGDPDDPNGGVIHGHCATTTEISEWMAGLELVESILTGDDEDRA